MPLPALPAYRVVTQLASGGHATVALARRVAGGAPLVVKSATAGLTVYAAFEREATLHSRLAHPRIVTLQGFGVVQGTPTLALSYVDGVSLAALLERAAARGAPLEPPVGIRIALDLLDALAEVHAHNLVHGDISPRNALVASDGATRLCDFGAAGPAVDAGAPFCGSLAYGPPESIAYGTRAARGDLFSLAVLLWEALQGRRLFREASDSATMTRIVEADAPRVDVGRADLTPLVAVIARALARNPAQRHQAASTLRDDLFHAMPPAARTDVAAALTSLAGDELQRRHNALRHTH